MTLSKLAMFASLAVAASGALYALQDGGRDPGERRASTSLVADGQEGDEIVVSYNTLMFSPNPIAAMRESAETREAWASFIPQLLQGTVTSDVDLTYKDYSLPSGKYNLSFAMIEDGGWELYLAAGDRRVAKVALDVKKSEMSYDYLNLNLLSTGGDTFRLIMGYGDMAASVDFGMAEGDEG